MIQLIRDMSNVQKILLLLPFIMYFFYYLYRSESILKTNVSVINTVRVIVMFKQDSNGINIKTNFLSHEFALRTLDVDDKGFTACSHCSLVAER